MASPELIFPYHVFVHLLGIFRLNILKNETFEECDSEQI